jgi:hypothetical protein
VFDGGNFLFIRQIVEGWEGNKQVLTPFNEEKLKHFELNIILCHNI